MKMSTERYALLLEGFRTVQEHCAAEIQELLGRNNVRAVLWGMYHRVTEQLMYGDDHPHFLSGYWTRIIPQQEGFRGYDDNGVTLHDDHIETAIRRIGREIGVE